MTRSSSEPPAPRHALSERFPHALNSWQRLLQGALAFALTGLGVGLVAGVVWGVVPRVAGVPPFATPLLTPLTILPDHVAVQKAFEAACLSAPFLACLAFWIACRVARVGSRAGVAWLVVLAVGGAAVFGAALIPSFYCPDPPVGLFPPVWLVRGPILRDILPRLHGALGVFVAVGLAALVGFASVRSGRWAPRQVPDRRRGLAIAGGTLVALSLLLAPIRWYAPSLIDQDNRFSNHFNILAHALSQALAGRHLLVDFPHQYGGYAEFLAPVVGLFPHRLGVLLSVFPLLHLAALFCLLGVMRLAIARPWILLWTGVSLLSVAYLSTDYYLGDHYYNYNAVRTFFPALGLLAAAVYFLRPGGGRYLAASGVAALAPIWNIDTGVVLWIAWTVTVASGEWRGRMGEAARRAGGRVAVQVVLAALAWGAFALYLRAVSGHWGEWDRLLVFQRLFFGSGVLGIPLLFPDLWMLVALIYLAGIVFAVRQLCRGGLSPLGRIVLMVALTGLGLFSYFVGRAAGPNLLFVSSPAIVLLGILVGHGLDLIEGGRLPRLALAFLAPALLMLTWWSANFVLGVPRLAKRERETLAAWTAPATTPFLSNAAFLTSQLRPGVPVLMLSMHSGFYHYLSGPPSPLPLPGPLEWMRPEDIGLLLAAIDAGTVPRIVLDQNFKNTEVFYSKLFYQRVLDGLAARYRVAAVSPSGEISLFVPR